MSIKYNFGFISLLSHTKTAALFGNVMAFEHHRQIKSFLRAEGLKNDPMAWVLFFSETNLIDFAFFIVPFSPQR